jgi:exodeoxyribonuclease-1
VPLDGEGKGVFKLEHLAPANGIAHGNAHDAMGDVKATLALCRLIMDEAPDVWSTFMRFSQKKSVISHLEEEPVCSLSDVYFGKPYSYLIAPLGPNAENSAEFYVFDLGIDANELRGLSDEQLAARLCQRPKPVRVIKCNGAPVLMAAEDAPDTTPSLELGWEEIERRAQALRADSTLCERLMSVFESTREVREPSVHVEEQIYDGFAQRADEQRMEAFHEAPWEERSGIVESFDDPRLISLGRRLIGIERPDLLDQAVRQEMDLAVARRIAKPEEGAPWLCLTKAIAETEAILAETADEAERILLEPLRDYLNERMDRTLAILG